MFFKHTIHSKRVVEAASGSVISIKEREVFCEKVSRAAVKTHFLFLTGMHGRKTGFGERKSL